MPAGGIATYISSMIAGFTGTVIGELGAGPEETQKVDGDVDRAAMRRNFLKMKMMENRSAPQSVSSQAKISMNAAHEAGNSAVVKTQAQDYSSESFFERKERFSTERRSLGMKLASKFA